MTSHRTTAKRNEAHTTTTNTTTNNNNQDNQERTGQAGRHRPYQNYAKSQRSAAQPPASLGRSQPSTCARSGGRRRRAIAGQRPRPWRSWLLDGMHRRRRAGRQRRRCGCWPKRRCGLLLCGAFLLLSSLSLCFFCRISFYYRGRFFSLLGLGPRAGGDTRFSISSSYAIRKAKNASAIGRSWVVVVDEVCRGVELEK